MKIRQGVCGRLLLTWFFLVGAESPLLSAQNPSQHSTSLIVSAANNAAPSQWDCSTILELLSRLAGMPQVLPSLSSGSASAGLIPNEMAPDWLKQLAGIQQTFQPHFDFIRFADSDVLLQVSAIELRALGIKKMSKAREFLREFTSLTSDRQLAFVNGVVFRLLWETQNSLPNDKNQSRLLIQNESYTESLTFLSSLKQEELPNLTLFLMCHFGFRADTFGARLESFWENSANYTSPFSPQHDLWLKSHGIFLNPEDGQRLYNQQELITLMSSLISIRADRAIDFFIATEAPNLSNSELRALLAIPNLRGNTQEKIHGWLGEKSSQISPNEVEANRLRLLRAAESELAVVETRLRLMDWVDQFQEVGRPLGDPSALFVGLQEQVTRYMSTWEQESYTWLFSGLRFLLALAGYSETTYSSYFIGGLLSQTLQTSFARPMVSNLQSTLDQMAQQIGPIMAYARELQQSPTAPADTASLTRRRDEIRARIATLQRPSLR